MSWLDDPRLNQGSLNGGPDTRLWIEIHRRGSIPGDRAHTDRVHEADYRRYEVDEDEYKTVETP